MLRNAVVFFAVILLMCSHHSIQAQTGEEPPIATLDDLIRLPILTTGYYDKVVNLGSAATPKLLRTLEDESQKAYWNNCILMLGFIGDESVVDFIIEFIKRGDGDVISQDDYITKTKALKALGYLVNKNGNTVALNYLIKGIYPDEWRRRKIQWLSPLQDIMDRDTDLSKMSMLGLSLTGHPDAINALNEFTSSEIYKKSESTWSGMVESAHASLEILSKESLSELYKRVHRHEKSHESHMKDDASKGETTHVIIVE